MAKGQTLPEMSVEEEMRFAQLALNKMLDAPAGTKKRLIDDSLTRRADKLAELLPDSMKDQALRLIKRALLTFERNPRGIQDCTPESFIYAVLEAAEVGLPIDGRLCYVVPYNTKVKKDGRESWEKRAKAQPSYLGLVAVAKRSKQIRDCYGNIICEHDNFKHGRSGTTCVLEHTYDVGKRGDVRGAWAIVDLPDGSWRYEIMDLSEIEAIRARSKSKDDGPWVTDTDQMRIKTVIRRILKLYCDDPAITRAMDMDDDDYEPATVDPANVPTGGVAPATKTERLVNRLADKRADDDLPRQSSESAERKPDDRSEQAGATAGSVIAAQILSAATAGEVAKLYDQALGPDSDQEFSVEESNAIAAARDQRLVQLAAKGA
ncbi:MAG: recombinase RecT [Pirellulales bacterium]